MFNPKWIGFLGFLISVGWLLVPLWGWQPITGAMIGVLIACVLGMLS